MCYALLVKPLEKKFKAFANVSRLKILGYLKKHKAASVTEICHSTKCSYKATSKHLAILYHVDVVEREQVGFEMHYRISDKLDAATLTLLKLI